MIKQKKASNFRRNYFEKKSVSLVFFDGVIFQVIMLEQN